MIEMKAFAVIIRKMHCEYFLFFLENEANSSEDSEEDSVVVLQDVEGPSLR